MQIVNYSFLLHLFRNNNEVNEHKMQLCTALSTVQYTIQPPCHASVPASACCIIQSAVESITLMTNSSSSSSSTQTVTGVHAGPSRATAGPGKTRNHSRGALSQHHFECAGIQTPKASKGRKHGEGCPLSIWLGVYGSIVSSPSWVRGRSPTENEFYAHFSRKEAI